MATIQFAPHPRLAAAFFVCEYPHPLAQMPTPDFVLELLKATNVPPLQMAPTTREAVRSLLRWGGFKPSGRSKPASEFLEKACSAGTLGSINLAVDLCNVVSLWSGFPISVIDLDVIRPPLRVSMMADKISYVFNPSGQELDLQGLLCLWDEDGPCGSPVKDSQRSKTSPETTRTLSLIWGDKDLEPQVDAAARYYRELCKKCDLSVGEMVEVSDVHDNPAGR